MKIKHQKILELVKSYLEQNPKLRFTQALFNLDINQKPDSPDKLFEGVPRDNGPVVLNRIPDHLKKFKN